MMRYLAACVLGISLLAPTVITAQEEGNPPQQTHQWNDQENEKWHQYLKEKHKKDHDWEKATKREQKAYWKWRDAHPDAH